MRDLALLVADKNMDFAMRGILSRHVPLGIRRVDCRIDVHPHKDGGVRTTGPETLAPLRHQFRHGLLMLDWEGSGADGDDPLELEQQLDKRLKPFWGDRAKAIVLVPEVDVWMWGSDNALRDVVGWTGSEGIRGWLHREGFAFDENDKPIRPKEAMDRLLKKVDKPRSSRLYEQITQKISLQNCADPSFRHLRTVLRDWFPRP
jgi:hypothetical protein